MTIIFVGLAISACATPSTNAKGGGSTVGPKYIGPIAAPVTYGEAGIVLRPPSSTVTGASWQKAYATCKTDAGACGPGDAATIALADATTTGSGTTASNGTFKLLADNAFVYVITFASVPCLPVGVPPPPPARAPPRLQHCTIVDLFDAQTGAVILSSEFSTD